MQLTHKIRIDPTVRQREYFSRAAGTARFCYNWALCEWNRLYAVGETPSGSILKKRFNAMYRDAYPWVTDVHRDCHSQPFTDLQSAFQNFFAKRGERPAFKSRNRSRRSFYVANDTFSLQGTSVRLPILGHVKLRESLRFVGKINSARVVEECGEWYLCVSVDIPVATLARDARGVVGVDLGIKSLATLSTGEVIANPRPLKKAQERLRRAQRILSRREPGSENRSKQRHVIAKIHQRIKNIRHDGLHKLTTSLCRNNHTVVIEDLNVKGMVKNHNLAQALSDASFGLFRTLLLYKAAIFGTSIIVADRFFPSSKMCSGCGAVKAGLSLGERTYHCECGLSLDRDFNAALNLMQLAGATGEVTPTDMRRRVIEVGTKTCSEMNTT